MERWQIPELGIPLAPGDEVLSTREDYWAMWNTWHQRVEREGSVYREIDLGADHLLDRHEILVGTPEDAYGGPAPIRVTPDVFTSVQEVDAFMDVIEGILRTGVSGAVPLHRSSA